MKRGVRNKAAEKRLKSVIFKLLVLSYMHTTLYYTPGIYADGYIVFAFPFVRSSVRMFVRSLVRSLFRNVRGIYVKVFVKVSLVVYIS